MDKQDGSACNGMEGDETTKEDSTEEKLECQMKSICAKTNALKDYASIGCTETITDGKGGTECHENGNIEADSVIANKSTSPEKIAANDLLNFVLTKSGQHLNDKTENNIDCSKSKQDAPIANGDIVKNGDVDDLVTSQVLEDTSEVASKNSDSCLLNGVPETGNKLDENEMVNSGKEIALFNGEVADKNGLDGVETAVKEPDKGHEATEDKSEPNKEQESTHAYSDISQLDTKMELDESQELREESIGELSQVSIGEMSQESMGELRVSTSDDTGLTDSKNMSVDETGSETVVESSDTNVAAKHLTETSDPAELEIFRGVEDNKIEKEVVDELTVTCSGPPSLTKEVNSDNSVVSELRNTEEQSDVSVLNITGPIPNGSVEIIGVIEDNKHVSDKLKTIERLEKDLDVADEQTGKVIKDEQNLVAASEKDGEELEHNEHKDLPNNEKELVTGKVEKENQLVNNKDDMKLLQDEMVKEQRKDDKDVIEQDEIIQVNQVPDGVVAPVRSPGKLLEKSQKLDQLLSKITNKAELDSQKPKPAAPKQGKARKSCVSGNNMSVMPDLKPKPTAQSLTSLTFNVKELEKQGVLDIPKASKRKAFDPVKIPSPEQLIKPNQSPVHSPKSKSPGKSKNPLKRKIKRKKGRKMGAYKLPGELKMMKKGRKKESEERQVENEIENASKSSTGGIDSERSTNGTHSDLLQNKSNVSNDKTQSGFMQTQTQSAVISYTTSPDVTTPGSGGVLASQQINALDMLTKNYKRSFSAAQSSSKKARKTVRQGIDPNTHRTLDSFLKAGSHTQIVSSGRKVSDKVRQERAESQQDGSESTNIGEHRKRKASGPMKILQMSDSDSVKMTQEGKKPRLETNGSPSISASRPLDGFRSPPVCSTPMKSQGQTQVITLVPTGSPSVPAHSLIQSSMSGATPIILAPTSSAGPQAIIHSGTFNGMPMFQIFNSPPNSSSQGAQFVAIAQSQGMPILTSASPKMTTILQPQKGMPVLLAPIQFSTAMQNASNTANKSLVFTSTNLVSSIPTPVMGNQNIVFTTSASHSSPQKQQSVLKHTLTAGGAYRLPNGHVMDGRIVDGKIVANGLYPVTPPRTPPEQKSVAEDQRSESETQSEIEVTAGGSAPPDKDVVPLCTCKISGASFQKMASSVTFCQALDSVDGKVLGCCNRVTNPQLVRPAVKIPFLAVCEAHRRRLRSHQCCPGCGHFCTQGRFLRCSKEHSNFVHHFHEQCQVTRGDGRNLCPHCGEASSQYEVQLTMPELTKGALGTKEVKAKPHVKARLGLVDRRSVSVEKETGEATSVTVVLEKTKKTLSTGDLPIGPDRYSLEKTLSTLTLERPKKFRHLPKCLYTPAYDNDLERVIYMLEDGHDPNECYEDIEGQSALHAAAAVGSLAIVHALVQSGASPHLKDKSLRTPLMFAAENNHADVVTYLVKANTTIDAKADDGMTALHYAAKAGHLNMISLLLDTDRLDIDVTDDGGWTPLIWAAEHMQMEAVKLLLKRKADPNLRDNEENTTMHWAAYSGSVSIIEQLLMAGCDLDSLNMHGDRPLHIAARQDHYECVVLFLARGADVEAKNNKGETPLECCLDQNSPVYLALKVNKQLKSFGAKHMRKPERLLHRDLSKGRENIPIPCVNGVDEEGIPTDYLYVTDNIETTCLKINRVIGSLQTCQCKDDCSSIYCACGKNSLRCWYDKYGRLVPEFNMAEPPLIFECNRACECWTTCNNRVVQNGVMSRLQVFKTEGRGWGCKTLVDIPRGTFICEYIGEHISDSEADRREDDSYLFDLDNRDGETYCIDARKFGNVARFINHLCQPNLVPVKVFVDSQDLRFPRICLFASRTITAQEELGFDYGEKFWIIKWKQFTCTCGSTKCRYSKETIQQTLAEYRLKHELEDQVD
ncbi:uncharacterized protein LOC127837471 isoform X2 [Dreissena polymorpha]|uniref:uncharacterized protein LOC127837471 isoform X2 n=1 Tax=Dreissena polymorpha TaxID=45954 RepID=UPI0022655047|nr:uncharacterized protein LOC127837471 isoform X2 [Dreissena polymorpha]